MKLGQGGLYRTYIENSNLMTLGQMPDFSMICTFAKSVDESAFLISIPMKDGKPLVIDENQKILIRYNEEGNDNGMILAGYVDDVVKEGIRRYWKVRRVSEQRQFFRRTDERLKVAIPISYMQETWRPNLDGIIQKEQGMSLEDAKIAAFYADQKKSV